MTSDHIDLQRRADEAMTMLRRDGYRAEAEVMLEMRQALYAALSSITAAQTALRGGFPLETDR